MRRRQAAHHYLHGRWRRVQRLPVGPGREVSGAPSRRLKPSEGSGRSGWRCGWRVLCKVLKADHQPSLCPLERPAISQPPSLPPSASQKYPIASRRPTAPRPTARQQHGRRQRYGHTVPTPRDMGEAPLRAAQGGFAENRVFCSSAHARQRPPQVSVSGRHSDVLTWATQRPRLIAAPFANARSKVGHAAGQAAGGAGRGQ